MSQQTMDRLFSAFSQADASTARRYGGTGLGLLICKQIVSLMGGTIGVESEEAKGSTFWFEVQFAQVCAPTLSAQSAAPAVSARALNALVADDNAINQLIALKMLRKLGHEATAVGNGLQVLDALKARAYDVIFMDCQMPELDGYETTKLIREGKAGFQGTIPIVAMTANAMQGDREECLRVGMNDYMSKPMRINDLTTIIARLQNTLP